MIQLTRMDGRAVILNAECIQTVESTPDTLITLTTGNKFIVQNTVEEVVAAFKKYKREVSALQVVKGDGK